MLRADFKLELCHVTEQVSVTAEGATLRTGEASLGDTVEQRRLASPTGSTRINTPRSTV
ncbi:MAG: hypothetical protein JNK87_41485 [Bryobacterales bacterium]|nr:hypothetical protein [Bryobacterales bacterium]